MPRQHILIATRDSTLRRSLADYLQTRDFLASTARSEDIDNRLAREVVDVLILDMHLSGEGGLSTLRRVRDRSDVPVVVLSELGAAEDRTLAIELGADDCMELPLNLRELLARICGVLRRRGIAGPCREQNLLYQFAGWTYDTHLRRLTTPAGAAVRLTAGERRLLLAFLGKPQRVLSREHLLDATHTGTDEAYDRSVDMQVWRLRRKLEAEPGQQRLLRTERSAGYVFIPNVEYAVPLRTPDRTSPPERCT